MTLSLDIYKKHIALLITDTLHDTWDQSFGKPPSQFLNLISLFMLKTWRLNEHGILNRIHGIEGIQWKNWQNPNEF